MHISKWQAAILASGELYRVGGRVRDRLLGLSTPTDTDFMVRGISPVELEAIFKKYGHADFVGKSFGVYKFTASLDRVTYDVAYARREQSVGSGHRDFSVEWDESVTVEEDLRRRDFTINAIAESVGTNERFDPFGGQADLQQKTLRIMFDGAFIEDPLRILRGLRFMARFDFGFDPATSEAMHAAASSISTISTERVQEEFSKLLRECDSPSLAFIEMRRLGILKQLIPELDRCVGVEQNEFHPDDVFVHSLKSCDAARRDSLLVRWAALLHDLGKVDAKQTIRDPDGDRVVFYGHEKISAQQTVDLLSRLRYPRAFVHDCAHLVMEHMFHYEPEWRDVTIRRFIRRIGEEHLEPLFALREADCRSRDLVDQIDLLSEFRSRIATEFKNRRIIKVTDLQMDGVEVMKALNVNAGPEVGKALNALLDYVTEQPDANSLSELKKFLMNWQAKRQ